MQRSGHGRARRWLARRLPPAVSMPPLVPLWTPPLSSGSPITVRLLLSSRPSQGSSAAPLPSPFLPPGSSLGRAPPLKGIPRTSAPRLVLVCSAAAVALQAGA